MKNIFRLETIFTINIFNNVHCDNLKDDIKELNVFPKCPRHLNLSTALSWRQWDIKMIV